jgi:hypothetical protein
MHELSCPCARFHAHVRRTNSFNIFDFVVVFITTVSLIPGLDMRVIGTLRLLRAFRVVRIFARLESARKIITALSSSIVPVCNVLVVVLGKLVFESSLSTLERSSQRFACSLVSSHTRVQRMSKA